MQSSSPVSLNIHRPLMNSVQEGMFLPFLGDGASSLRANNPSGWQQVQQRILMIRNDLLEQQETDTREAEVNYLRTLAGAYDLEFPEKVFYSQDNDFKDPEPVDSSQYLHPLRVALVKMGTEMVGLFGRQMDATRACVEDIYRYKVSIKDQDDAIKRILKHLADALEKLNLHLIALQKNSSAHEQIEAERYLEANAILTKLLILAHQIGASYIQARHDPFRIYSSYRAQIEKIRLSFEGLAQSDWLSLAELAWIEDLLWHTLRYNVPAYLSTNEMTFRLSLQANSDELRRLELVQMAELTDYRSPLDIMEEWLEYCETNSTGASEFHRTLAATLVYLYEHYRENERNRPGIHLPMAITTIQDRALEQGLRSLRCDYHVVFPISRTEMGTPSQRWLFQTYTAMRDGYRSPDAMDCSEWVSDSDVLEKLKGPLIVKLHGSPQEEIEQSLNVDGKEIRQEHLIVLSESEYLRSTVIPEGSTFRYPSWIGDQLKAPGSWWFLGYSIDDWFIRLRIFQHLSYSLNAPTPNVIRLALDFGYDPYRSVVLDRLNIQRSPTALTTVQAILSSMPEIEAILKRGPKK